MKLTTLTAACIIQYASAHYFFDTLIIDGVESKSLQYVRDNTRPAKYNPTKWKNTRDDMTPDLTDFRCNKGSFQSASKTSTAEVKAGAKLGMKLAVGATFQHPGPMLVYMSKAPSTANTYEGDGDWFKVYEAGICDTSGDIQKAAWCSWDKDQIDFTVPAALPEGEYLVRSEHVAVHGAHDGQVEFYYGCAQVKVSGGTGTTLPTDTIKFPGGYKNDDASFNYSVYSGYKPYTMPGPAVWGGSSSTSSVSSSDSGNSSSTDESNASSSGQTSAPSSGNNFFVRGRRAFRKSIRLE